MSSARVFLWLELSFLTGVAVAGWRWQVFAFVAGNLVICLLIVRRRVLLVSLCVVAALAGVLRFQQSERWQRADDLVRSVGRSVTISGRVAEEPDRRINQTRYVVAVRWLRDGATDDVAIRGRTLVVGDLYPVLTFGEGVTVRCRLERPEPINGFAYDDYLALGQISTLCRRPTVFDREPAARSGRGTLFALKGRMMATFATTLPEPHAALLGGILLGARSGLPTNVTDAFRTAGLSHLVALSGYNITVLVAAVLGAVIRSGGSRRHAFWLSTLILAAFVVMTGAAASVVRAAIMGFLAVLARHVGRGQRVWYALVFSATAMVAINPRILASDIGWHLSFLATLGLVCFARPIQNRLGWLPDRFGIRESVATTVAATLATLPLIAVQFDRISLIGLLANLLVLPVMPLIMLLGALVLVPIAGSVVLPALWGLLTWVLLVAEVGAAVPWSSLAVPALPSWSVMVWYGSGGILFLLWRRLHQSPMLRPSAAPDGSG